MCSLKMVFSILYFIRRFKHVTLSQQQLFIINIVCFLNFNMKNLARFGIFHPKWLIALKMCLFYIARCYHNKIKMLNFYSKSQVSVNLVKSLGSASSVILLTFIDFTIWVKYYLQEKLFNIPSLYSSWVKFTHCYAPN